MKTILFTIIIVLFTGLVYAGDYVVYDDYGYITDKIYSVDGNHPVASMSNALMIPRNIFNSLTRWHKVKDKKIVEMTQAEKDVILQAEADAQAQAIEENIQELRLEMKEVLTALIQVINKRIPNNPIGKNELIQQIKDNRTL